MSQPTETSQPKRSRRTVTVLAVTGGILVLGAGGAWLFRTSLAEAAMDRWCDGRDLVCSVDVDRLDSGRVELSALSIETTSGRPLAADRVLIDLDWPTFLSPRISRVEARGARLSAEVDEEGLRFHGLEDLFAGGEEPGGARDWPQVDVRDARIDLATPAGMLSGTATLALESRTQATLGLMLEPAELRSEEGYLSLGQGSLNARLVGNTITGRADIELREGAFDDFFGRGVLIEASLDPDENARGDRLVFRLAAQALRAGDYEAEAVVSSGEAGLRLPDSGWPDAPLEALTSLVGHVEADRLVSPQGEASALVFDADLSARRGGGLAGPVGLTTGNAALAGYGRAEGLTLSGTATYRGDGEAGFDGLVSVRAAGLDVVRRERLLSAVDLPGVLERHGEALRTGLSQTLAGFSTALTGTVELSDAGVRFSARGPARLSGSNGAQIALAPYGDGAWLALGGGDVELRGGLSVELPAGPDLTAQVNEVSFGDDGFSLRLGETQLAPWSAGGLTLAADLDRLTFSKSGQHLAFAFRGETNVSGRLYGADVRGLDVFGSVEAVRGAEGWRAQLLEGECIDFSLTRLSLDNLRIGPLNRAVCPPDGRLVRQGPDGPEGRLVLGALVLPYATEHSSGELALSNSTLEWRAGTALGGDIRADRMDFTLNGDTGTIELGADTASLSLALTRSGRLDLAGEIGAVRVDGEPIPADVGAASGRFALSNRGAGLSGTASLQALRVADIVEEEGEDAMYQPILSDLEARLESGVLHATGPVRLEASGRSIGRAELDLAIPSMHGDLRIDTGMLAFRPGGLQMTDLSERLRGFFTDTSGQMSATAMIGFGGGPVTSSAEVNVSDLGFQTVGLGRVSGVAGNIVFDDLIGLTTPPEQRFRIGTIDPGIELTGGEAVFQMVGGGNARLVAATFPFAGGTLAVQPTEWRVGEVERVLTLEATGIGLAELTDALSVPGLDAEGTVSGRFPIAISGSDVFVREARLVAEQGGGVLRYTGDTGAAAGQGNENVEMAFRALRDFRFSVLEIGANGNLADQVVVTARLEGSNPEVLSGTPFNFNISVDSQLARLLETTRQLTGTDWLAHVEASQRERTAEPSQP